MRLPVVKWVAIWLALVAWCARAADPLALIADINGRYGSAGYHARVDEAIAAIIEQRPAAVIVAGDMVAGQARPLLDAKTVGAMWRAFDRAVYRPLADAGIEVLAVPGNHDASVYADFAGERRAYDTYWSARPPAAAFSAGSSYPFFYGVDLDGLTFAGLDVTTPGELDARQRAFLETRRLEAAERGTPLLVATHLPLYPIARGRETEVFSLAGGSRPGEIWVSGHHHAYYAGVTATGALHLALPALGGNQRGWLGSTGQSPFGFVTLDGAGPALHPWPGFRPATASGWPVRLGALTAIAPAMPRDGNVVALQRAGEYPPAPP